MAFRSLNIFVGIVLLLLLISTQAQACFGPKLFVGVGQDSQEETLFALVTLYVQEKTGVESTRVDSTKESPLDLLTNEKVDLVFVNTNDEAGKVIFRLDGLPLMMTGPRPLEDLQFTTVLPAIKKLNQLLSIADVENLIDQVKAGESALSVARKFLMQNRWI